MNELAIKYLKDKLKKADMPENLVKIAPGGLETVEQIDQWIADMKKTFASYPSKREREPTDAELEEVKKAARIRHNSPKEGDEEGKSLDPGEPEQSEGEGKSL